MVEQIVAALIGGIVASTSKIASKAVEDAYNALKSLLVNKLGEKSDTVEAVTKLEKQPHREDRKATVAEELKATKVSEDPELLDTARRLQTALDQLPAESRAQVQHAIGNYIAQASGGSTATVNVDHSSSPPKPFQQ